MTLGEPRRWGAVLLAWRRRLERAALVASLLGASACHENGSAADIEVAKIEVAGEEGSTSGSAPRPAALEPAALGEALRALEAYVPPGESVLEVRATADRVLLQVRQEQTDTVAEYAYDGRVIGPVPTHLAGSGELEANLYDLETVNWRALTRLFPEARDAVDPADGVVTELVVRRHLPFSRDVIARLYVASPRMNGQLDADARGKILPPPARPDRRAP